MNGFHRQFYKIIGMLFLLVCFSSAALSPVYASLVSSSSDAFLEDEDEVDEFELQTASDALRGEIRALSDAPSLLSIGGDHLVNCVRFDVRISGSEYILLLPSDYESSVMVDSDGYLWNMTSSQVQGRIFQDAFDPTAETGQLLYLGPCLGNNFSNNRDYGSPNYIRNYYWQSGRLTYDTDYVTVQVVDSYHLFKTGDLLSYAIFFIVACCLVCLWKRSGR